ncbi:UvrD-helicase domain-containing protein [Ferrimicrobium sp.]|uniref:UvrD-helicase domain-containing protein n=1 Tax=Ferrimicrobium sp. TaxID=2926050 RepID=UPI002609571C|nr:UvrD-helicase domain-containing protein [Ferrimicrobium sp.]
MELSEEQKRILAWDQVESSLVVDAKAGTGKTTTASERIRQNVCRSQRTLALTFTRNGAHELATRVSEDGIARLVATNGSCFRTPDGLVVIATFDYFLRTTLRSSGLDWLCRPPVEDQWLIGQLWGRGSSMLVNKFPQYFDSLHSISRLRELVLLIRSGRDIDPQLVGALSGLWLELDKEASGRGRSLPGDFAIGVVNHAPVIAAAWLAQADCLIVDESQDTSKHELRVLAHLGKQMKIPIITFGDPGQNLMAFRGALGDVGANLEQFGVAVVRTPLSINRRSVRKLVSAQNALQEAHGWPGKFAVAAGAVDGYEPLYAVMPSEGAMIEGLQQMLRPTLGLSSSRQVLLHSPKWNEEIDARIELLRQAGCMKNGRIPLLEILVPSNDDGAKLTQALAARNIDIPFLRAKEDYYDTEIVRNLQSWCSPDPVLIWAEVHSILRRQVDAATRAKAIDASREVTQIFRALAEALRAKQNKGDGPHQLSEVLTQCRQWITGLRSDSVCRTRSSQQYLDLLVRTCDDWLDCHLTGDLVSALDALGRALFVHGSVHREDEGRKRGSATQPWIFAEALKAGIGPSEIRHWVETRSQALQRQTAAETVYPCIKTIHTAKGDTVDVAILYRADKVSLQRKLTCMEVAGKPNIEKQNALGVAYVACTRSRFVQLELALGCVGECHGSPLRGWTYVHLLSDDARCLPQG